MNLTKFYSGIEMKLNPTLLETDCGNYKESVLIDFATWPILKFAPD